MYVVLFIINNFLIDTLDLCGNVVPLYAVHLVISATRSKLGYCRIIEEIIGVRYYNWVPTPRRNLLRLSESTIHRRLWIHSHACPTYRGTGQMFGRYSP